MSADRSTRVRRNCCFRWTALWPPPLPSSSTSCTSIAAEFKTVAAVAASSAYSSGAEMSGHQEARSAYRRCPAALPVTGIIFAHPGPASPSRRSVPHPPAALSRIPSYGSVLHPLPAGSVTHPLPAALSLIAPARSRTAAGPEQDGGPEEDGGLTRAGQRLGPRDCRHRV